MQKQLNQSICHLGCGFRWAKGSTSSIVFVSWRQCAPMGQHIGATWQIRLNRPSTMRPYVKLPHFDHLLLLYTNKTAHKNRLDIAICCLDNIHSSDRRLSSGNNLVPAAAAGKSGCTVLKEDVHVHHHMLLDLQLHMASVPFQEAFSCLQFQDSTQQLSPWRS